MNGTHDRDNPFPGLRPFAPEEAHLFFGREDQIADLVQRLRRNRFVAVVGSSGSGKSSLVKAGLLPALRRGVPTRYGSKWRIAMLRPGDAPIRELVQALGQPGVMGPEDKAKAALQATLLDTTLRRSALGLLDAAAQTYLEEGENLLVLVDQFEELFRFKENARAQAEEAKKAQAAQETTETEEAQDPDEASAFVKLLLEAARSDQAPIYIVLTMRSDFLGDCTQFRDLPEAISNGQFLVPRMTRGQRQRAIEGPIDVANAHIEKRLVQRLLNDVGDNPDQLPIMQHALMRTWDYWSDHRRDGEALDIDHYEAIGTMAHALSRHADEVYNELPSDRSRLIAERMFKRLTDKGIDNRGIRRPTRLDKLCIVCEADEEEVKTVIEAFRRPDRSLLMPPANKPLKLDTYIDISHESLMRVWGRLIKWVDEEAEGVAVYRRLAETAALETAGKASLWRGTDLRLALDFRKKTRPSAAWAGSDDENFDHAMGFLERSRIEERNSRLKKFAVASAIIVVFFALIFWQGNEIIVHKYEVRADSADARADRAARINDDNSEEIDHLNADLEAYRDSLEEARDLINPFLPEHQGAVQDVAFSPDGTGLASGSAGPSGPSLYVWDVTTAPRLLRKLQASYDVRHTVRSVAFSPNGRLLASGNSDGTIDLWNARTGAPLATLDRHLISVRSVAFSPDSRLLASGSNEHEIILWDAETGDSLTALTGHTDWVNSVAFSRDGTRLASGSADGTIIVWDVETGQPLNTLRGHSDGVNSVAFNPSGTRLASGSNDRTIILWNVQTGQLRSRLRAHYDRVTSVDFSPGGDLLASGSRDGAVRLWNASTGALIDEEEPYLRRWRAQTNTPTDEPYQGHLDWVRHSDWVMSVAFSPDGKLLATGSGDQTVGIWKLDD